LARATYNETVANYRQTILGAFQEIEDQLAAQQLLDSQLQAETAQSSALSVERTVVQLRGQKFVASIGLIRALGGGWQADSTPGAETARK
jgi:outer membrane protein TolC